MKKKYESGYMTCELIESDKGMGSFMDPPGYPTRTHVIKGRIKYQRETDYTSPEYFLENEKPTEKTAEAIKATRKLFKEYKANRPPLTDPAVREWILKCFGYFRNCWKDPQNPERVNANNCIIKNANPFQNPNGIPVYYQSSMSSLPITPDYMLTENDLYAVIFIRRYYPKYEPTEEDYNGGYWGKKPE